MAMMKELQDEVARYLDAKGKKWSKLNDYYRLSDCAVVESHHRDLGLESCLQEDAPRLGIVDQ